MLGFFAPQEILSNRKFIIFYTFVLKKILSTYQWPIWFFVRWFPTFLSWIVEVRLFQRQRLVDHANTWLHPRPCIHLKYKKKKKSTDELSHVSAKVFTVRAKKVHFFVVTFPFWASMTIDEKKNKIFRK